jgi:3-dehydroquinate synthase
VTVGAAGPAALEVTVAVEPPYRVHVGRGVLAGAASVVAAAMPRPSRVLVVSDDVVAPLHGAKVGAALEALGCGVAEVRLPSGEAFKSLATYAQVLDAMAAARLDRRSLVVALGGGVVGDVTGFAAATYMRGLPHLQVPTTLLAMVDSSVGGKTGVNLGVGKNLVGAFWQPVAVVADTGTLATLPIASLRHGAVELFKAGLLGDAELVAAFGAGSAFAAAVTVDGPALPGLIARGVAVKAKVVAGDPRELRGEREVLNLGHTVAHALETLSRHRLTHGEAVAYGLLAAAEVGARRGLVDWRAQARDLLAYVAPGPLPEVAFETLLDAVARDKKHVAGRRRFVLLEAIGRATVVDDVSDSELAMAWETLREVGT